MESGREFRDGTMGRLQSHRVTRHPVSRHPVTELVTDKGSDACQKACPCSPPPTSHKTYRKHADPVAGAQRPRSRSRTPASSSASSALPAPARARCCTCSARSTSRTRAASTSTASASTTCRPKRRDRLRNQTFGFIFQFYHLLPELTTLENVLMPQMIAHSVLGWLRQAPASFASRPPELLDRVGLGHRLKHKPRELPAAKCSGPPSPAR